MKIVDIANEIYIDNGSPTDTSIPAIAFWVRGRIGALNVMLFESFYIDPLTQEMVDPDTGAPVEYEVVGILKQMYRVYDLEVQIRKTMNALANDTVLKYEDQGTTVVRVNRNMMAQTLHQVRKDEIELLKDMVGRYVLGSKEHFPLQVAGDDTIGDYYGDNLSWYPTYLRR
jgi:hypothetical protein